MRISGRGNVLTVRDQALCVLVREPLDQASLISGARPVQKLSASDDRQWSVMQINTLTALPAMVNDGRGTISLHDFAPGSLVALLPHVLIVTVPFP